MGFFNGAAIENPDALPALCLVGFTVSMNDFHGNDFPDIFREKPGELMWFLECCPKFFKR